MVPYLVVGGYFLVLLLLTVIGIHRYLLIYLFHRNRAKRNRELPKIDVLPSVTVQLPVYNEQYVVERLIRAAAEIDYPAEKLSIQVLDDSTDETTAIAKCVVEELTGRGVDIELIRRDDRTGYKAGALENGLALAKGELVAIFDADFVPCREFLAETVPHFIDETVGMVQVRWAYLNEDYSLLTRLQAMFLDGHFVVEHSARNWSDRFFNFNGTAGIWRKQAIKEAGGWEHDTLTEDLDLSYRAQMKGWKFVYKLDTTCASEIPVEMNSYKTQQHRWAKGSIETGRKLLPRLVRSKLPLKVKIEAFFHMGSNLAYLLLFLLSFLTLPSLAYRIHLDWKSVAIFDLIVFVLAFLPVSMFYIFAQKEAGKPWRSRIAMVPLLMSLGIGLSVSNARAVVEGLVGNRSAFVRTPKYRVERRGDSWWNKVYRNYDGKGLVLEGFLTLYTLLAVFLAIRFELWFSIPFLSLFTFGFGYVFLITIYQTFLKRSGGQARTAA
jgi:cellulose synthase/poly-beta-1,6-N-acetylglucosamine synthase-like glycosyltransferase